MPILLNLIDFLLSYVPRNGLKLISRIVNSMLYPPPPVIHVQYDKHTAMVQSLVWMCNYANIPVQTIDGDFSVVIPDELRLNDGSSSLYYLSRISKTLPSDPMSAADLLEKANRCLSFTDAASLVEYITKYFKVDEDYLCGYDCITLFDVVACSCLVELDARSLNKELDKYADHILDYMYDEYEIIKEEKDK